MGCDNVEQIFCVASIFGVSLLAVSLHCSEECFLKVYYFFTVSKTYHNFWDSSNPSPRSVVITPSEIYLEIKWRNTWQQSCPDTLLVSDDDQVKRITRAVGQDASQVLSKFHFE